MSSKTLTATAARRGDTTATPMRSWSGPELVKLYRNMVTSRRLDDAEIDLRKRNEVYFQISSAGHESVNVAIGALLKSGHDWFYPYYRDRGLMLQVGLTPYESLLEAVGGADDPASHGTQMPSHFGLKRANVVSQSSPTGTQFLQAVGCAQAARYILDHKLDLPAHGDEIVHVSSGDGTTNQGDFHEALSQACIDQLPVLFVIEDNNYAISVPIEKHTPGGDIAKMVSGYAGLTIVKLDGNDMLECLHTLEPVIAAMRRREIGPVLVHVHVTRPYSHSLSDDQAYYRTKAEIADEASRDCLQISRKRLIADGLAKAEELDAAEKGAAEDVKAAVAEALKATKPELEKVLSHLYATENSPADRERYAEGEAPTSGDPVSFGQAINQTMHTELARDERVRVWGQDTADASREAALKECKGKGGVFKLTHGLQQKFGSDRCYNAPLAESKIAGTAIGQATRGVKPLVEIQFFDYIWTAMMQIRNEMGSMRFRSGGEFSCPLVLRVPIGGYLRGGSICHSQTGEAIFAHCPGLRIAYPCTALDAVGLLRTAIRCDDPVLFLEHKHLYYQGYNRSPMPGPDYTIPFGVARKRRSGDDLVVFTWGALVQKSIEAADKLAKETGAQAEVWDLRTINPLDEETILSATRRVGKVVIAAEENVFAGFGGHIASVISEKAFEWLDAPVRRVGSMSTWVAYHPALEAAILPNTDDVLNALREVAAY